MQVQRADAFYQLRCTRVVLYGNDERATTVGGNRIGRAQFPGGIIAAFDVGVRMPAFDECKRAIVFHGGNGSNAGQCSQYLHPCRQWNDRPQWTLITTDALVGIDGHQQFIAVFTGLLQVMSMAGVEEIKGAAGEAEAPAEGALLLHPTVSLFERGKNFAMHSSTMLACGLNAMASLLSRFSQQRLLVTGDLILDRYWWGEASRLSPEAPVPVLLKKRVSALPGGAANTAANIAALSAQVEVLGVLGDDDAGRELLALLAERGMGASAVQREAGRPTTTKTRLIAGNQHLLRVDEEEHAPLPAELLAQLATSAAALMASVHAVVVSDYAKGLCAPAFLQSLLSAARAQQRPSFLDPKGSDAERYRGVDYLKPNRLELGILAGRSVRNHAETLEAGRSLRDRLTGTNLLVTEAADGMTYFGADGQEHHVQSEARRIFDITGAGDTVMATFAVAITAGAHPKEAMELASAAAAIAITQQGCATVSVDQLA
jgi:D-glycero-beta-D-manno-heptose-7-phosphate kinase